MGYRVFVGGLALLLLAGCGGNSTSPDAGELPYLDEPLGPGEVRAGVIRRESELLGGPEAHGWIGDFKLVNDRVAFVVQNAFEPRGWGPYGGSLLDADRVRPAGEADTEVFQEAFVNLGLLTARPLSAEVVSDGRDGSAAVVRLEAIHQGIPLIDAALNGSLVPRDLEIALEYELAPDTDFLRLRTCLRARQDAGLELDVGDVVLNGDRTADFAPIVGPLDENIPSGELAYFAGVDPRVCLLFTGAESGLRAPFSLEGITPMVAGSPALPAARGDTPPLCVERLLLVGEGGLDDCLRRLRRLRGEDLALGLVSGTVADTDGVPETGASLTAWERAADGARADFASQTYTGEDGGFELELPAGDYLLLVPTPGRTEPENSVAFSVAADQTTPLPIELERAARLAFSCDAQAPDGTALGPVPCKLSLQAGPGAAMTDAVDTDLLAFTVTGLGEIRLPPGDWTATLSRGWEYSIHRQDVQVPPGGRAEIAGSLVRQVDTAGWIAADLHNHSARSADSDFELLDKIASNAAEGLELLVVTDHDCQNDLSPWVARLERLTGTSLGGVLRTVVGNEVSPLFAHLTAFPLPTHPSGWIYWQVPWTLYDGNLYLRMLEFPEIWERVRSLGAEVINVAHPLRDSGYFDYLGFDPPDVLPPLDGLPAEKWGTGFDTLELLNSSSVDEMLDEMLPLWSALNNQGLFRTAVGVSDTHGRTSEAGFGRTLIAVSDDDPARLDLTEVWANLKAGRALVGAGILVRLTVGGAGPGELVSPAAGAVAHLEVEAADWVPVEHVVLLANGDPIADLPLGDPGTVDPTRPALRLREDLPLALTADTWLAAVASGAPTDRLDPVFRGDRPAGMSNAIRLDVDGDGVFTPRGL